MFTIGIDIGATKTIFVLMKENRILENRKVLTPKKKDKLIEMLERNILELKWGRKINRIGIGVPGPLNEKRDLILNPPNLKCLWRCHLAKILENRLKIKIRMDNDVNCFTLGETASGAARNGKVVFGITLGTGVGGGLVLRYKSDKMRPEVFLYRGVFGSAGEIGHMTIKFDGLKCSCKNLGCLEEYCSERFFKRKKILPPELEERARRGEKKALKIFKEYGKYLGIGLANVINLFDPEIIVVGGGIANAFKFFIKDLKKEIKKRVISQISKKRVKIKKAELGELAGAIGATYLEF